MRRYLPCLILPFFALILSASSDLKGHTLAQGFEEIFVLSNEDADLGSAMRFMIHPRDPDYFAIDLCKTLEDCPQNSSTLVSRGHFFHKDDLFRIQAAYESHRRWQTFDQEVLLFAITAPIGLASVRSIRSLILAGRAAKSLTRIQRLGFFMLETAVYWASTEPVHRLAPLVGILPPSETFGPYFSCSLEALRGCSVSKRFFFVDFDSEEIEVRFQGLKTLIPEEQNRAKVFSRRSGSGGVRFVKSILKRPSSACRHCYRLDVLEDVQFPVGRTSPL